MIQRPDRCGSPYCPKENSETEQTRFLHEGGGKAKDAGAPENKDAGVPDAAPEEPKDKYTPPSDEAKKLIEAERWRLWRGPRW